MLSRFFHEVKICEDVYAVYNSLLMDVLYVNQNEMNYIHSCSEDNVYLTNELYRSGIYIHKMINDQIALDYLQEQARNISGNMDIMYLILTQNCNLKCTYCFLDNNPHKDFCASYMNISTAQKAVDKFYNYLIHKKIEKATIIFYGGEPLIMNELFVDIVKYAEEKNYNWMFSIITNGTLVNGDIVDFCVKHNITIGLSLDGPAFIHDKNRKYKVTSAPSYNDCMKTKSLLDLKKCHYGLSIVLSRDVIDNKQDFFDWMFSNHQGDVFFNLLHFSNREPSASEYIKLATEFMIEFYEKCEQNGFALREGRIQRQIDSIKDRKFSFSDCGAVGCHQITVLPSGEICICHGDSVNSKEFIGLIDNIDFFTFRDIDIVDFWSKLSTLYDEECLACPALFSCGRGCPQHAENLFGNRADKDKNYCFYVKEITNWLLHRGYFNQIFERSDKDEKA